MRVCDYISKRLVEEGVRYVYGMVGGGCSGLNDGFFQNPNICYIPFHHEQGAGNAAVGSARTNKKISVVNVTTGCGGTNVLTSCLNAWQESVPVLFLSGNTKLTDITSYINKTRGISLRKYGIQDHDIVNTVKTMTKYSVLVEDINMVAYELEKAIHIASSGRFGPVWLDIPSNIQTSPMPEKYEIYSPEENHDVIFLENSKANTIENVLIDVIYRSKRPVVIAGAGISHSDSVDEFRRFIDKYKVPFVTNFLTRDIIEYEHPQNIGMWGIKGNRAANFAVQNSDCLIILGSSMNVTHVGYDTKSFSPHSKKIMIDIDSSELSKGNIKIDVPIQANVKDFLHIASNNESKNWELSWWGEKCLHWKNKWPIYNHEIHRSDCDGLNLYEIVESLNRNMQSSDIVVADAGQPCYICSTNLKLKRGQKYMVQAAQGDMGYAIPAVVGVHFAAPESNIIACIGEGSFHTNMQELAVIRKNNIPVKIFVINNDGYMSLKQTQTKFFGGNLYGVNSNTGIYFADLSKIANAFEMDYIKIQNNQELDEKMSEILRLKNPVIVEFISKHTLDVLPAQAIKSNGVQGGLHDMSPFLSEEELKAEMLVDIP